MNTPKDKRSGSKSPLSGIAFLFLSFNLHFSICILSLSFWDIDAPRPEGRRVTVIALRGGLFAEVWLGQSEATDMGSSSLRHESKPDPRKDVKPNPCRFYETAPKSPAENGNGKEESMAEGLTKNIRPSRGDVNPRLLPCPVSRVAVAILFTFLQKHLIKGLTAGAMKG
jgi:hypothetical protein